MTKETKMIITVRHGDEESLSYMEIVRVDEKGDESKMYRGYFKPDDYSEQYGSVAVVTRPGPDRRMPMIV